MLDVDQIVGTTLHCPVSKYVFPMEQLHNMVWVSSRELKKSLVNACDEAAVHHMAKEQGAPVLELTVKAFRVEETLVPEIFVTVAYIPSKMIQMKQTGRRWLANLTLLRGSLDK